MIRAFQWDLARQVERLDWLLAQLPRYADWGYNELYLHLEDAIEYPSFPTVARKDAYSHREMGRLVEAAHRVGIKTVPIVNLLGHTQYLIKTDELRDLNELRSPNGSPRDRGQICPLHPRTLSVAESLLRDVLPFCSAGKVHLGLDESFHLGQHPLSRREIEAIGLGGHFAKYVQKLFGLTSSLKLQMGMWADMLYFIPEAIALLPDQVTAYEWYYHAFRRHPRVELFNFSEVNIATPLRERGIALYGCPMNGAFRFEPLPHFGDRIRNIVSWWQHCHRIHATGFMVSSWEPYRLAIELTTAIDAAAAGLWLEPEIKEIPTLLSRGFERAFGKKGAAAAKIALACDQYPFGGYPRWQINERWDTLSRREPIAGYRTEERYFANLSKKAQKLNVPSALRDSLRFRSTLATRDVAVRELGRIREDAAPVKRTKLIKRLRAALVQGRRAAKAMWTRTRDHTVLSPNERILKEDVRRLHSLQRGQPVFGGSWQLCYAVWNFAPAAQLVGIEELRSDGSWVIIQSCHTIEFQTRAAVPRSRIIREHAAPVIWTGDTIHPPQLRFFVQGVGQVKVGRIELRNGRTRYPVRGRRVWRILGMPAPGQGMPNISNRHLLDLTIAM